MEIIHVYQHNYRKYFDDYGNWIFEYTGDKSIFLEISDVENIRQINSWPVQLKSIVISSANELEKIPDKWPEGVIGIELDRLLKLTKVPSQWPEGLKHINLSELKKLEKVPNQWPENIETISLFCLEEVRNIPNQWPSEAKDIYINHLPKIKTIPYQWPNKKLENIQIINFSQLKKMPDWPSSVKKITLCSLEIKEIKPFPNGVESLDLMLHDIRNLSVFAPNELPSSITRIVISLHQEELALDNRILLQSLTSFIDSGGTLEIIRTPILHDAVCKASESVINKMMRQLTDLQFLPNSIKAFEEFLSKESEARDMDNAKKTVQTILNFVKENPDSKQWIEHDVMSRMYQGYINQPVAAVTEIAAWVNVALQESFAKKMEMTRALMVLEEVRKLVMTGELVDENSNVTKERKPRTITQVEAQNYLLKECYKRLVEDKRLSDGDWDFVPKKVFNEKLATVFYEKNLNTFYQVTVLGKVMNMDLKNLSNYINETNFREIWNKVAFLDDKELIEKVTEIDNFFQDKIAVIERALNELKGKNPTDGSIDFTSPKQKNAQKLEAFYNKIINDSRTKDLEGGDESLIKSHLESQYNIVSIERHAAILALCKARCDEKVSGIDTVVNGGPRETLNYKEPETNIRLNSASNIDEGEINCFNPCPIQ